MKSMFIKFLLLVFVFSSVNLFADSEDFDPKSIRREIERLNEIRDTDPERYEKELREYKQTLKDKIQYLKKNDPEKYEEIRGKMQRKERSHVKGEFEKHPDRRVRTYAAYTNRLYSKLMFLKENDPESYMRLKERIEQEREDKFNVDGRTPPPPHPFFQDMRRGDRERKKFGKDENLLPNDMKQKIAEIEKYIDQLPPEQQEEARERLAKKIAEKNEHFKKLRLDEKSPQESRPPEKDDKSNK